MKIIENPRVLYDVISEICWLGGDSSSESYTSCCVCCLFGFSEEYVNIFHIFDIEKTVVDIIYYRNKLGIEETSEILRNYLKRRERQIDRLYKYAKLLRCEKNVRTYLEVLL